MNKPVDVAILMGSKSDWDDVRVAHETLDEFGVAHESRVLSAHRTPGPLFEFLRDAEARGCKAFICCAGAAAHLAGVVAGHTLKPVLGVPMSSKLNGLDSLLSTVQMPRGIPVATFAIGKAGAGNAALFAVQLLSLQDAGLAQKLANHRKRQADTILAETLN